jgi:phospholipid transport system transporter-binding protein
MKVFIPCKKMIFSTVEGERQRLLAHCEQEKDKALRMDLSQVEHCDSAGLAFLIEAKRIAGMHNKTCEIVGMTRTVQALAEFCGVEMILA